MKTYETNNGTYDLYVNFDVQEGKSLNEYAYFQHTDEIVKEIADPADYWAYCSATALAQCISLYYNDETIVPTNFMDDFNNGFNWGNDTNKTVKESLEDKGIYGTVDDDSTNNTGFIGTVAGNKEFKGANEYASTILGTSEFNAYVSEIKDSLKIGRPVIICVFRYEKNKDGNIKFDDNGNPKVSTHYVTIVGVKSGIDLDNAEYTDFVMFDPGTQSNKNITTLDDPYTEYIYYPYNYRIITPYVIDEDKEFVLDENGNKTTDPYYLDPRYDSDGEMYTPEEADIVEDIEDSVNSTNLPQHEKDEIIEKMIGVFVNRGIPGKPVNSDINESSVLSGMKEIRKVVTSASKTRYDPLIFDLDGDGYNVEKKELGANFDLDKNGFAEKINWTKKDGFLCLDLNGNGTVDDGGELFGDQTLLADGTRAKNGFEALAQYDSNGDGVIDAGDGIFDSLRIWVDADGNGVSGEGEMKTLAFA